MKKPRRPSTWFWLALVLVFALLSLVERGPVQDTPPPLAAADLNGNAFTWADLTGRPALLYFWATWCPVCSAMRSSVRSVAKDHPVVTVALQSGTDAELRNYLNRHELAIRVFSDPAGAIAERYRLRGVPALFFIDRNGQIRFSATGYTTEIGIRIRLWLMAHMA